MGSGPNQAKSTSAFPTPCHYQWLALGFAVFVVYGSLVPLDYRPLAPGDAIERYRAAWKVPIRVESRSDWISNILLFIPLGFLLSGWLAVDRPRRTIVVVAIVIPVISAALSSAVEFAQVYFPSRTVSARDVVAELIGGTLGGLSWLAAGPWLTRRARSRVAGDGGRAAWLLPIYLMVLGLSRTIPMDLTISPGDLYHKYKSGMIILIPFVLDSSDLAGMIRRSADEIASFFVAGLLMGSALAWRSRGLWIVFIKGLTMAGCIEILQLFVASRRFDTTDVVIGGSAVLGGWIVGKAILGSGKTGYDGRTRIACFAGWLCLAAVSSWSPFDFDRDIGAWTEKVSTLMILPFADYHRNSVWNAADQIIRKATLFIPLGMLMGRGVWRPLLVAAGLAVLFEAGQLALPGREPSVTDFVVAVAGTWCGAACLNPARSP